LGHKQTHSSQQAALNVEAKLPEQSDMGIAQSIELSLDYSAKL
jgi:hypothetical protein